MEMLLTVTPPTCTGSIFATGVTAPVLPTWHSTDNGLLVPCLALNLNATAQRGWWDVIPSLSANFKSFTLDHHAVDLVTKIIPVFELLYMPDHRVDPQNLHFFFGLGTQRSRAFPAWLNGFREPMVLPVDT